MQRNHQTRLHTHIYTEITERQVEALGPLLPLTGRHECRVLFFFIKDPLNVLNVEINDRRE